MIVKNPHARIVSVRFKENVLRIGPGQTVEITDKELIKRAKQYIKVDQLVEIVSKEEPKDGPTEPSEPAELPSTKAGKPKSGK